MRIVFLVSAALAALGAAGFFSYLGLIVAKQVAGIEGPQGDLGWAWIFAGIYGGWTMLLFGAIAFIFRPRDGARMRRGR